jgi:hypothetical protein
MIKQFKAFERTSVEGVASDLADEITEAILNFIRESKSGVVELNSLMEYVNAHVSPHRNINLDWAIIKVKKSLETAGIIRLTYSAERVQLISFASRNSISMAQFATSSAPVRLMVAFKLVHEKYSSLENQFVEGLLKVLDVAYIEQYELIRNNGKLNPYEFIVTCNFKNYAAFDRFLHYKPQIEFRQQYWERDVVDHTHFVYESQELLTR